MSVDLNNLKEQIQSLLQTANTTTASRDLSTGLETRVQRVLKVNPSRIPIQASWYPFVTIYIDAKDIELQGIAVNQQNAKRRADVSVKVVGAVWNSTVTDEEVDPADEDCEDLLENIEEILRANPTLAGSATWSYPEGVAYHSANLDEETHIRAGILTLRTTIFY
jgi:hypothetical protein